MGKLASKVTKRIMASVLTVAMIMSNMTVYASEYSEPAAQTEETVDNTETGAAELPSTNDETVQGDAAQDEGTQDGTVDDETSQEGTEGDAQDTDASDENSNSGNDVEEGDASEPEEDGGEVQEPEETDADIQESEDELEAAEVSEDVGTITPRAGEHTLWLVGDSTVCSFNDSYFYPRYGYGTQIGNYLDDTYTVRNLALSGRSSKSFLAESNYKTLTDGLSAGDVLVIGFGHNDEKAESERYTNPNGDYQTEDSFAKSLYDNYVKKAIDAGAEVILCTPIVRRNANGTLSNADCHITNDATDAAGKLCPGGDYPEAIRKLVKDVGGANNGIYLVDLTALTKELYNDIGADETLYLHAWTGGTDNNTGNPKTVDNTHLNIYGAKMVAWMFAKALSGNTDSKAPAIKAHIKSNIDSLKPNKNTDLVKNPNYVKPNYRAPENGSAKYPTYTTEDGITFQPTFFGDSGGAGKITADNFRFGQDDDGNMTISCSANGKITATYDSAAMYYYRIPAKQKFIFSAKAKLNSRASSSESAFGLMARDDMYIDLYSKDIASDYVAAGSLGHGSNCFYRKDGELHKPAFTKENLTVGKEYELKITFNGDGYTCTFGNEDTQSGSFDYTLTSVDPDYAYIGMFVTREVSVTFSDIHLEFVDDGDYSITVSNDGNGTARASKTRANAGAEIDLTALPKSGYAFKKWEVLSGGVTITDNKFTMPAKDVEIKAIFEKLPVAIDVWDFGGKVETDSRYNNHITPETMIDSGILAKGGTYADGSAIAYGDLKQINGNGDKLYTNTAELAEYNAGEFSLAQYEYDDGYTAAGAYYCNGSGDSGKRCITIEVNAGDKITAYMGSSSGDITFRFAGQSGSASKQSDSDTVTSGQFKKFEFTAEYKGTYKIWPDGSGKPMYHRIMRVPSAEISGTIDFGDEYITGDYSVKFVNQTTGKEISATVADDDTFTAKLAPGYTYRAVLVGVTGYGFTAASANLSITDDDVFNGKSDITLVAEYKAAATFSGTIRGFAAGYDLSNLEIMMVPKDTSADSVKLQITKNEGKLTFTSELAQNMEYSFLLNGVNDYEVSSPLVINTEGGTSLESRIVFVTPKPVYNVIGGFIGLTNTEDVTALKFTNLKDNYEYDADLADGGYSVDLRDGEYVASATVTGYKTNTHVVVNGGSVSKDLLFVSTAAKDSLAKKSDIYVGYPDKDDNYATVKEAVKACERMEPASETDRITVHIAPGTYREQIIIDTPYISFVNDTDEEVLLTWYYGIGYKYYSADSNGFYNPENAYDKFDKHIAAKWGTTVYLKSKAQAFRAEGITFENSFNRYMTDEEIEDGVEVSGTEDIKIKRYQGLDVTSKAATERASVIVIDKAADKAEFLNCNFYSSQDTVMTGGAHTYFRNCVIEGQTDYICGKGNCVFDACELRWKGYSTGSQGGYLAVSQAESNQKGYLFRNCTVTANSKLEVKPGYWGRPWSKDAGVVFMNTKLQTAGLIVAEGWTEMSGTKPDKDRLKEYNTTTIAGETVDTSKRADYVMTAEAAAAIKVSDYFGDWTPKYYKAEAETVAISGDVRVTDNADINTPKAGNTLTVIYSLGENDANDASIISWYAVEKNASGNEVVNSAKLLKISTAAVDKTYKIDKELVGKYIKVTVNPQTVSGKTGDAKSYTLDEPIREGYEDPSNADGGITLGDGINIFLAGDSTVKDYSAAGMYNNGSPLNDGSWGEFIQTFFNESEVKIQNYAQGGRSSRTFINDGKLKSIEDNIGEGDYLFIQFGHNDSSDNYPDRYVPVGTPDSDKKYPSTPGTPDSDGKYPDGGNGTFKWFLEQYINVAKAKGAIPVLVTPVARMEYNADGSIKAHHDSSTSSNNAYVTAVKQLAAEQNVLLIDGYTLTEKLFTDAWKADDNKSDVYGTQIMSKKDNGGQEKTHNNKLGGMIEAAAIASEIQKMEKDISYAVKTPARVTGVTIDGKTVFSVDADSKLTAYDINSGYENRATYWETVGNTMFTAIKSKAEQLTPAGSVSAPTATPSAGAVEKGTQVALSVTGSAADSVEIYYTTDGSSPKTKDNTATKLYSDDTKIIINENTTIKAYAKEKVGAGEEPTLTDSKVVTFVYTLLPSVKAPTLKEPSATTVQAGTTIKLETDTEDAQIRYTMGSNPADPTVNSPIYNDTKGIVITSATTIKAIAVKDGETSSVATFVFTIEAGGSTSVTVAAPISDTVNGAVELRKVIHLSTDPANAFIYFTKGTTPADPTKSNADLYDNSEGIVIDRSMTIKAIAVVGDSTSTVATFEYTVPTTKEPESNKEVGEVEKGTEITLTSETGAEIYYTTDRTDPRTSGTRVKYDKPIGIEVTTTIRTYAVIDGKAPSDVVTLNYTIYREPVKFTTDPALTSSGGDKATPHLGDTLTVSYVLEKTDEDIDTSTINWYRVDGTEKEPLTPDPNTAKKSYTIRESDIGKIIKVEVTPKIKGGKAGETKSDETGKVLASSSGTGKGLEIILSKEDYTYTGSAIIPEFTVTNNGKQLTDGVDYTVKYSNNKNANSTKDKTKRAKITVTGKGSFSGKSVANFTINPKSLQDNDIKVGGITVVKNKKVAPILVYKGIKLSAKDFTIDGDSKFPAAGEKTVKVKAKENGNFTGSRDIPVTVVESTKNLKKIAVTVKTKSYVFDGTPHYADIEVTGGGTEITNTAGMEDKYAVTYSTDCINAGTVKFTVIGMGEYTGTVTKSYKITPNKSATISPTIAKAEYPYVSTGVTVPDKDITVTAGGKSLTKDLDYKVTYSGNKKVTKGSAKAKANITFIGNYKGCPKKSLDFTITPATISKDTVKVFAADKIFKNRGIYKSVPTVIYEDANGVKTLLKKSDYDVKYYLDEDCTDAKEMKGNNKIEKADTPVPVYVKVTGKGNYTTPSDKPVAIGKYEVCKLGTKQDLSTAKVEFGKKGATANDFTKVTSIEYTGKPITFNNDESDYVTKVTVGKGKSATVVSSDKYTVKYYANNINKGTATIVIVPSDAGSIDFIGGKTATFKIVAQKVPATFSTGTSTGDAAANALNMFKSVFN